MPCTSIWCSLVAGVEGRLPGGEGHVFGTPKYIGAIIRVACTCNSAASMVYRYLNFQSHSVETCDKSVPSVIGKSLPYKRFKNSFLTFHTFDYGRRMKCASYFAYLSGRQKFVKIKPSGKNASE